MSDQFHMGWAGIRLADQSWEAIGAEFPHFFIAGQTEPTQGKTFRAWDIWRKLFNGQDMIRVVQETGDCVGMSMTDVVNANQAIEIVRGDREKWRQTIDSYVYAYSRVIVGRNGLRGGAGSVGSWMAKAVQEGGVLPVDEPNVPSYSGRLSDTWGDDKKYNGVSFRDFIDSANDRLLRTVARIRNWSELRDAVINGHLGTIASNRGYKMKPDSSGFHRPSGSWSHQMSILGLCDDPKQSWVAIGNQWGDQHGRLIDFETQEPWPTGMLRVTREDFEAKHLTRDAECFVYSNFDGFPDQSEDLEGLLI